MAFKYYKFWKRKRSLAYWKFRIYRKLFGNKCSSCGVRYLPPPHSRKFLGSSYPTKRYCGQCVYDMDSFEQSLYWDEYGFDS